jgi:hypothetical protein
MTAHDQSIKDAVEQKMWMVSPEKRREKKGEWEEARGRRDRNSAPMRDTEYAD